MLKNLKRYICIMLTAAMMMMFMPVVGITAAAAASGNGWSFDETTGTLTITTDGGTTAWRNSCDKTLVTSVEIQDGVTSIGESAFLRCANLISIEIPDSVQSIGWYAFQGCLCLESIKIPYGVKEIGLGTFWDCSALATTVDIPESVTSIKNFAFVGCRSLESIEIPDSVKSIGESAFYHCRGLKSVEIPNNVTSIGCYTFKGCTSLASITIPDSVVSIDKEAFMDCSSLTSITIPDSVTSVGTNVFSNCSSLDEIIYPSGLDVSDTSIPDTAAQIVYANNNGAVTITEIVLPDGKEPIEIPETIYGKNVTGVAADFRDKVSSSGHTHQNEEEATCEKQAVCKICGSYGELAEHTPDEGTVTHDPTYNSEGEKVYRCTVCGAVVKTEILSALGGDPEAPSVPSVPTEPTTPVIPDKPAVPDKPNVPEQPDSSAPFIKNETGKTGWDAIKAEVENTDEGGTVAVDMNGTVVVPGSVFDTLKGKDVTIVFDMGEGITWSVNGKDITSESNADIDFSVRPNTESIPVDVVNSLTGERYSIQISLAHNGGFGFTAVLSINLGVDNAGRKAALYYYNNGALELMSESEILSNGTALLKFTHASDYLIVIGAENSSSNTEAPTDNTKTENPLTGAASSPIALTAAAVALIAAAVTKPKKR